MTTSDKRIALVTGASRGLGRAAALALAQAGWHVIATARAQKALEALDDEIAAKTGANATLIPLDLKDMVAIDQLGAALYERFGRLDGFAHCAGVLGDLTPTFQMRPTMFDEAVAVNVTATYRLIRALFPLLRASPAGRAVFVTTGKARNPTAYWGAYAATKAAQESLALTFAAECAPSTVRANLISPGPTRTAMRAKAFPGEDPATLKPPEAVAPLFVELLRAEETRNGEVVGAISGAAAPPPP